MRPTRHVLAGAVLALALPLVSGCGGEEEPQVLSDTEHNDQDVAFATDMVQHHAQALSMVDLTLDRPLEPEVAELAEDIRAAQGPEIEQMVDWLVDWDEEVPPTMRDHVNVGHGDHSAHESMEDMDGEAHSDMPGMLSAEELAGLEEAGDAEFADLWLELMIAHHEGAIEMARTQQAEGMYRPAVDLAAQVVDSQAAEVELMRTLLEE